MGLADFNTADRDRAAQWARVWASIDSWALALADARPFGSVEAAAARADELSQSWTAADLDAALADHPRIGRQPTGDGAAAQASRSEQAAVGSAEQRTVDAIAQANADYEARFGRVFLIRAAGRSAEEILAHAHRRLGNDEATESGEALAQLREIALLRLHTDLSAGEQQ
ncbi:2-oxo-4-hydroxy-4-carboxy-5-ureidoimidazoline decarboxylase [Tsukamurella serpentis]